jgi:hypothetical protein
MLVKHDALRPTRDNTDVRYPPLGAATAAFPRSAEASRTGDLVRHAQGMTSLGDRSSAVQPVGRGSGARLSRQSSLSKPCSIESFYLLGARPDIRRPGWPRPDAGGLDREELAVKRHAVLAEQQPQEVGTRHRWHSQTPL